MAYYQQKNVPGVSFSHIYPESGPCINQNRCIMDLLTGNQTPSAEPEPLALQPPRSVRRSYSLSLSNVRERETGEWLWLLSVICLLAHGTMLLVLLVLLVTGHGHLRRFPLVHVYPVYSTHPDTITIRPAPALHVDVGWVLVVETSVCFLSSLLCVMYTHDVEDAVVNGASALRWTERIVSGALLWSCAAMYIGMCSAYGLLACLLVAALCIYLNYCSQQQQGVAAKNGAGKSSEGIMHACVSFAAMIGLLVLVAGQCIITNHYNSQDLPMVARSTAFIVVTAHALSLFFRFYGLVKQNFVRDEAIQSLICLCTAIIVRSVLAARVMT